ncbi:MAG TPA: hypothetical protein PKY78_01840 [Candidatus Omnitrophota bacterium]|nr:hypothetical protein [Candidatus Omnitrophota bacterium]HPS19718.1 hypothetical protein [Candidatus Omnitrophota bacterium]
MSKPVISRYLSDVTYDAVRDDFVFLIDKIKESGFEYGLQIRDDYLNLYYKGNSIGKISYRAGQKVYEIKIHRKFVDDSIINRFSPAIVKDYAVFILPSKKLHPLFSSRNLASMGQKVKAVQFQEEIVFEQMLLTDNVGREDLIVIDRQVVDRDHDTKMDLLGLKQAEPGKYQFCVIEVKLGNNPELREDVFQQLKGYVERITRNFPQYKKSYELNFIQKQGLGLMPSGLKIEIVEGVLGIVVVGGYSGLAEKSIAELKAKHPDIKVLHIKNEIRFNNLI